MADPNMLMQTPPGADPAAYAKAMRQQQIAQMLAQAATTPPEVQNPQPTRGVYVQPRVSALSGLSKLAEAVMARKGLDQSNQNMAQMYAQGLQAMGGGGSQPQPQPAPSPGAQDSAPSSAAPATPPGPRTTPLNPIGLPPQLAYRMYMEKPEEYGKILAGPDQWQVALRANGGDPSRAMTYLLQTPEYRTKLAEFGGDSAALAQATKDAATKGGTQAARQGEDLLIPDGVDDQGRTKYRSIRNPNLKPGQEVVRDAAMNPIGVRNLPGAVASSAAIEAADTAARENNTPRVAETPGGPTFIAPNMSGRPQPPQTPQPGAPPPAGAQPPTGPKPPQYFPPVNSGQPAAPGLLGPGTKEAVTKGAEAGVEYRNNLAQDSNGATEVLRGLSEAENLAKQATPNAANASRVEIGRWMVALGADPATAAQFTGADPGAVEAAVKQTASLALANIHQMTNRGTNFDLDTFMKNNPNLMQTPGGFQRVVDYMRTKSEAINAKQRDFEGFIKPDKDGNRLPPEEWMPAHTAHWNEQQEKDIKAGKYNSPNPQTVHQFTPAEIQAEISRRAAARQATQP